MERIEHPLDKWVRDCTKLTSNELRLYIRKGKLSRSFMEPEDKIWLMVAETELSKRNMSEN